MRRWALALLLYLFASAAAAGAQSSPPIRFSAPAVENWMQAYFAQETGRFAKAGLNVELTVPVSAANILTSVATGNADFGIAATTAIAQAISNGFPLVVIAPAAISTPQSQTDALCVAKSSTIRTAKDFEGKTVGVIGLKQFGDVSLRTWLAKNGADASRVRVIQAPFAEMGVGLERGTYDGAMMTEPTLAYALKNNAIRCIAYPDLAIAPRFMVGGWVTTKDYLAKNPDIVKRVAAVLSETAHWANTHRDEEAALVTKLTKIDADLVRSAQMRPYFAERVTPAEIQAPVDAAFALGFIPRHLTANEMLGR
jgi:NitT/TauT family transport system substrate-binding protein